MKRIYGVLTVLLAAGHWAQITNAAEVARPTSSRVSVNSARIMPVANLADTRTVALAPNVAAANTGVATAFSSDACRDAYRACMDDFCLLSPEEGARCACSDNIAQAKSKILEIQKIQSDAENIYTTDVERETLGARARLVFGESDLAKNSSKLSGISLSEWLNVGQTSELGADSDIGANLYNMAYGYCAERLAVCGTSADMEESLYSRLITQDCKAFDNYLADQKKEAENNKKIAEAAVRSARLAMLDTTNKFNRGECLLAYKSCISDKGGCGENFENCLDTELLGRRANACENILDQCMAVRDYVVADWAVESETVLVNAAKFADTNRRATCMAKIQACLEDNCATGTNATCLTNVNIAAGICPIIDECNEIIPGIKQSVNADLAFLRANFCQNDIDKCLQDKCGKDYSAPECLGKSTKDIVKLCPQDMYPSCKNETQFDIIVSSAMLGMTYQNMVGCVNYFGAELGRSCGTDMNCLAGDTTVAALQTLPQTESETVALRDTVRANSKSAVDAFFKKFEKDITVAACKSSSGGLGRNVFNTAKIVAEISAENRALRELDSKLADLLKTQKTGDAERACKTTYLVEAPDKDKKNYSYIQSVSFEAALCNCHITRVQQVCETGGESKNEAGLKTAAGGLAGGAALGTSIVPGWGSAIGAAIGGIGGYFAGRSASEGRQEFCQEIVSSEDVAMSCN